MTRRLAITSEKGGTGKSTLCINLAACLARMKKKILVLDADPQANTTMVLLRGEAPDPPTLADVLTNQADAGDTIRKTGIPGLDILPGAPSLAEANVVLASEMGRERRLRLAMRGADDDYDLVIADTSPQRTLVNVNVLSYVSEVYCPVDPGIFSLAGLVQLQAAVAEVVRFLDNPSLTLRGLILSQARGDNLSRDIEAQLRATFGSLVLKTTIPASVKVGESHVRYLPVVTYAPRSPAARAFETLTKEVMRHGEPKHGSAAGNAGGVASSDRPTRRSRAAG
jgi:chromosome partitioning protein